MRRIFNQLFMKIKFLLAILFVVGLGFTSMAQGISVGPRVGATFAKVKFSSDEGSMEFKNTTGFQVGAVVNYNINEMFSIQPELLLVQKGFKVGDNDEDGSMSVKYNYLEVPILAKVSFGTEAFRGFATAGPTLGYLTGGKYIYEFDGEKETEDIEFEDEDRRFEAGMSIGVGAAYKVGAGELNLDVRYGFGLTSLNDSDADADEATAKNRVFGVSLAYIFSL